MVYYCIVEKAYKSITEQIYRNILGSHKDIVKIELFLIKGRTVKQINKGI